LCFRDEVAADGWLKLFLALAVVRVALAAWKVLDLTCLMVWHARAQTRSPTTQSTIRENQRGHGKLDTTTQADLEDKGTMTEGHGDEGGMLDPRDMVVAVFLMARASTIASAAW
jgi:hypothetical protein